MMFAIKDLSPLPGLDNMQLPTGGLRPRLLSVAPSGRELTGHLRSFATETN
jgi:hypothetical protein